MHNIPPAGRVDWRRVTILIVFGCAGFAPRPQATSAEQPRNAPSEALPEASSHTVATELELRSPKAIEAAVRRFVVQGDLEQAIKRQTSYVNRLAEENGPDHWSTIMQRAYLAELQAVHKSLPRDVLFYRKATELAGQSAEQLAQRDFDAAVECLDSAETLLVPILGIDSVTVAFIQLRHGEADYRRGLYESALFRLEQAAKSFSRLELKESPYFANCVGHKGLSKLEMGESEEAEALLRESMSLMQRIPQYQDYPLMASGLARLLASQGMQVEAEAICFQAEELLRNHGKPDSPVMGAVLITKAEVEINGGNAESAIASLQDSRVIMRRYPRDQVYLAACERIAGRLRAMGLEEPADVAEAEPKVTESTFSEEIWKPYE